MVQLREQLRQLQISNEAKDVENRNLHQQFADAQEQLVAAQSSKPADLQGQGAHAADDDDVMGDDALRKRLQRLCERKKNGSHGCYKSFRILTSHSIGSCIVLSKNSQRARASPPSLAEGWR